MFTLHDTYALATISKLNVTLISFKFNLEWFLLGFLDNSCNILPIKTKSFLGYFVLFFLYQWVK